MVLSVCIVTLLSIANFLSLLAMLKQAETHFNYIATNVINNVFLYMACLGYSTLHVCGSSVPQCQIHTMSQQNEVLDIKPYIDLSCLSFISGKPVLTIDVSVRQTQ